MYSFCFENVERVGDVYVVLGIHFVSKVLKIVQ